MSRLEENLKKVIEDPSNIRTIEDPEDQVYREAVLRDTNMLAYVPPEKQTRELCMMAIEQSDGWAYEHVVNTKDIALASRAVELESEVFGHVDPEIQNRSMCMSAILRNPDMFAHVRDDLRTEDLCTFAAKKYPETLRFMTEEQQTPKVRHQALMKDPLSVEYMINPSSLECAIAIQQDYKALAHIKEPSDHLKAVALARATDALDLIENPSDEVLISALSSRYEHSEQKEDAVRRLFSCLQEPSDDVCNYAASLVPDLVLEMNNPSDTVYKTALGLKGELLADIENPSDELIDTALAENGMALECVPAEKQTPQRIASAIDVSPDAVQFVNDQSMLSDTDRKWIAWASPDSIQHIEKQTPEMCEIAIKRDVNAIKHVKQPTEGLYNLAVEQNGGALQFVPPEKQTPYMWAKAIEQSLDNREFAEFDGTYKPGGIILPLDDAHIGPGGYTLYFHEKGYDEMTSIGASSWIACIDETKSKDAVAAFIPLDLGENPVVELYNPGYGSPISENTREINFFDIGDIVDDKTAKKEMEDAIEKSLSHDKTNETTLDDVENQVPKDRPLPKNSEELLAQYEDSMSADMSFDK